MPTDLEDPLGIQSGAHAGKADDPLGINNADSFDPLGI